MYRDIILQIIDAAINGKTLDLSNYINDQEFMRIMKEQTFLPFLYKVDKRKEFRKYYYQSCLIHEKFNEVGKIVDDILTQNNIPHVFLKGYEIQNLYPDPNLRMMGDIDLLVKPEDYKKALHCLINNEFKAIEDSEKDYTLLYNNISIELHHKLFEDFRILNEYFNKPFDNIKNKEKFKCEFDENYNFIYIFGHYAKHINMGAGLRELIDIYLLLQNKNLNIDYITSIIKKFNLEKFFNMVLNELYLIFNYNSIKFTKNNDVYKMIDYCLNCGIHGFGEKSVQTQSTNALNNFYNGNKFVYLFKKLFIPIKELFKLYSWSKLIITIPFAYLFRFFYLLKNRRNKLKETILYKQDDTYKLLKSLDLMNKI